MDSEDEHGAAEEVELSGCVPPALEVTGGGGVPEEAKVRGTWPVRAWQRREQPGREQTHLLPSEDDPFYIAHMINIILEDFKARVAKNLNFTFLIKATALDPRFKKLRVLDDKAQRENIFQQRMVKQGRA